MVKIIPANSARTFSKPAKLVREVWRQGLLATGDAVLEVGAGCLRNAAWLLARGAHVDVLENEKAVARYPRRYRRFLARGGRVFYGSWPTRRYKAVVCTFVLGVVTSKKARVRILHQARGRMRADGLLLLSVRGYGDVKTKTRKGKHWRDGFITPIGTFIKPFRREEVLQIAASVGFAPCPLMVPFRSNSGIVDLVLVRAR